VVELFEKRGSEYSVYTYDWERDEFVFVRLDSSSKKLQDVPFIYLVRPTLLNRWSRLSFKT
jgi:hypothetical protein